MQGQGDKGSCDRKIKRTILKTPNMALKYRRVEGRYGLAYDAENIKEP